MPTLAVAKEFICGLLGKPYTDEQFEDLCFKFGVELDDITSEKEIYMREQGKTANAVRDSALESLSDEKLYKIDIPANRYDLLSAEGMTTALKVFSMGLVPPRFQVLNRKNPLYNMQVERSVRNVRDYIVCAVLRNIRFNERSYNSFIDYQEKLHSGLARRRSLASVGTHDLDKIGSNNFLYAARAKESIKFVPLRQTSELNCAGDGLGQYYAHDRHIGKYVPLISSFPAYPVVMDGASQHVLSLPPIINSSYSSISVDTRNIFIECTATDHYKAQVLVNQLVCAFSMYCAEPFTVEAVQVNYEAAAPDGTTSLITPTMETKEVAVSVEKLNATIGIQMTDGKECAGLLQKMMYEVAEVAGDRVVVSVPPMRSDVLGPPDVMEDAAIAYGYDRIQYTECNTHGTVSQMPVSKVGHLLRIEMACAGYTELLTFSLCSRADAFENLGRVDQEVAAHIANPQTMEFQVCRPSLMPGILKTLSANKSKPLPQRFFECSDVVLLDNPQNFPPILELENNYPTSGAKNQRRLAAVTCNGTSSGLEDIHGLMEHALLKLGVLTEAAAVAAEQQAKTSGEAAELGDYYTIEKGEDGAFFPGRAMNVYLHRRGEKVQIGHLGVVHPNTLKAYDIPNPCSYMELNIQFLCTELKF